MDATEAIKSLRELQAQVIHGSTVFGEIADCVESLVKTNREMRHSLIGEGWTSLQLTTAWGPEPALPA